MIKIESRKLTPEELKAGGYEQIKADFPDATPDEGPFWVAIADRGDGYGWRGYGSSSVGAEADVDLAITDCEPVPLTEFEEWCIK